MTTRPFLRIPPFPGAAQASLAMRAEAASIADTPVDELVAKIRSLRVGGNYWGPQPSLPDHPYVLVSVADSARRSRLAAAIPDDQAAFVSIEPADPWHLVSGAAEVIADAADEIALVAAISGIPVRCIGDGPFAPLSSGDASALSAVLRATVQTWGYLDPFTAEPIGAERAIELCCFWRRLIDSNRDIDACVGFAAWKRPTTAPLLWGGQGQVPFTRSVRNAGPGTNIAVWKSRAPRATLTRLQASGARLIEVEDGFIRSAGLGADCVAPLSIVVDRSGIYFDPREPSDLEQMLNEGDFAPDMVERAARLRQAIVAQGISKYEGGGARLDRRHPTKLHVLVPGQVEDDRSVMSGGGEVTTNLELLRRVRSAVPDAYLIYKPHPDVEAGHRRGAITDEVALNHADEVMRDVPISSAIEMVDQVHVNTSLAGFEALLRHKPVTTYGVPFYAGWGLTRDLGDVPARRQRTRTLDELVAAALLLYPRYLDPVSKLPCPPEILVRQISSRPKNAPGEALVKLRQLQGRLKRFLFQRRSAA